MDAAAIGLPALSDEQLAASYLDGADACFDELVRRYSGPLYAFILRMVGRPEDADDLTQDVFVQLLKSLPNARQDLPLRPWIYVIARNKCLDHLKRKKSLTFSALTTPDEEAPIEDQLSDGQPLPEELAERADLRDLLRAAIAALPPRYRTVVALRYSTDLTFAEIGVVLELPENTVKTHFQRAKAMLRVSLAGAMRET
jgi:RNA polymerase sigma factor (sigma-70 family)